MASLVLYGTTTLNGTLTTASNLVNATGGTETSKTTTTSGSNVYAEIFSQGGSTTGASSIQSPTGKGWVYQPGAGTFATGTWSASINLSCASKGVDGTLRVFKYSGGSYGSSLGTANVSITSTSKTTYSFTTGSITSFTTLASDLVYFDLWWHDNNSNISGDNPVVYESSTSSTGVASDVQITTSSFTASGGATHLRISDGFGGVFS